MSTKKQQGILYIVSPTKALLDKELSHAEYRLLTILCSFMDSSGLQCSVTKKELAEIMGVTARMIKVHLDKLKSLGYITVTEQLSAEHGGHLANVYTIIFEENLTTKNENENE